MVFARAYLLFMGAMSVLFGLVYLFAPQTLTEPTGFGALCVSRGRAETSVASLE